MKRLRLIRAAAAIVAFVASLIVYLRTLSPTVGLVDSGELTTAAALLGNAHPPGFPLYLMALHVVMRLVPAGTIAWRANFGTAMFASFAAAAMTFAAGELLLAWRRRKGEEPEIVPFAAISLSAGLLLAFSQTLWAYSNAAEVYTLNTALLLTILGCMLLWRRSGTIGWLYLAAAIFGLALGVHHVTIGLSLLAIAFLVVRTAGWKFFTSRQLAFAAAISIAALVAVYSYEPLTAVRHPFLNWGDPENWRNLVNQVTAKQYRQYMTSSKAGVQFAFAVNLVATDFAPKWFPALVLLALAGLVQTFRRDRNLFGFIVLLAAGNLSWLAIYPIVNDQDAYLLPTLIAFLFAAVIGAAELASLAKSGKGRSGIAAALLILPLIALATNYAARDRSRDYISEDLFNNLTGVIEPHGVLIADDYEIWSPANYFIGVEKRRQDLAIICPGLMNRGWYLDSLKQHYPQLMAKVAPQFDAYRPLVAVWDSVSLSKWSQMPDTQRIFFERVNNLLIAIVEKAAETGPVYATHEVLMAEDSSILPMKNRLMQEFDIVPQGVVAQYVRKDAPHLMRPLHLVTRGVGDGTITYDSDDVIATEILPIYKNAYAMRARYLAIQKDYAAAVAEYDKAIALDPDDSSLQRERNMVLSYVR